MVYLRVKDEICKQNNGNTGPGRRNTRVVMSPFLTVVPSSSRSSSSGKFFIVIGMQVIPHFST
jgi:hypothetical protein